MRKHMGNRLSRKVEHMAFGVALLLLGLIGFILRSNYISQLQVRQSALTQMKYDAEKREMALGYFFSERKDDIRNLASCREIDIFFENKALGMSMTYGLRASLMGVTDAFERLLNQKVFNGERIYDRVVFLDQAGEILATAKSAGAGNYPEKAWGDYLTPEKDGPFLFARDCGKRMVLVVSAPYFFKGVYSGQLLIFMSTGPIGNYVAQSDNPDSGRVHGIMCGEGEHHMFPEDLPGVSSLFASIEGLDVETPHTLDVVLSHGNPTKMYTSKIPIRETPFFLLTAVPISEIMGRSAPWHLSAVMGIIAVFVLGATYMLWRYNTRSAILNTRLDESSKREKEITEANLRLKLEVEERKRVERALRKSEERYRSIFESFQDIYFRMDGAGRIEIVSPSVREETGYDPEEVVGRRVSDFSADLAVLDSFMQKIKRSGKLADFELPLRGKDGRTIHVSLNARQITDEDGTAVGVEGVLRNVTQRKENERALQESSQRLDLALEGGALGAWDWNIDTGEARFSNRWAEMLEYSQDEIEPHVRSWEKLVHPEDFPRVQEAVQDHLEGRTPFYENEHRLKAKSGRWRWILDRGKVVERDWAGKPIRMAGTHVDVTRRKVAEQNLQEYQENLEKLVEERTRRLKDTEKELIKKAMEAGRAQLSAMVLHNIGNAITPIKVQVDNRKTENLEQTVYFLKKCYDELANNINDIHLFIHDNPRGKEVFAYLGSLVDSLNAYVEQQNRKLERMEKSVTYISEILTLQQAYAAAVHEAKERVDINALIVDALMMQAGSLEKRGIQVRIDLADGLPPLVIDRNRLMQVIVNIMKNGYEAIDEMSSGEETEEKYIHVRSFSTEESVGFSISDNGVGLDPAIIDSIFEFGESNKGSSGIGLYYCRMFVEANRGSLELASRGKGKGASVTISFPLRGDDFKKPACAHAEI